MDTTNKVPTTITTEKVNPILKRDHHHQGESATASSPPSAAAQGNRSTPGEEKKHLTWDEHAIEEHDLLRGTRMKIDEPNTPYTHYDHHSDEESVASGRHPRSPDENHPKNDAHALSLATQWNDVSFKLQAVADKRDAAPLSPAPSRDSNMSDSEDEAKKRKDHAKFKETRKKHYNEAEVMRKWRAEHANDGDDDDDDMEE
mmetsp:Transcript_19967/g.36116  ORF Transcript_19967/g.36116 Transcript_19967/m.36116 type:complete len:201 (-) Transcript_19967:110-712(-)